MKAAAQRMRRLQQGRKANARPELGNAEIQVQRAGLLAGYSVADAGQLGSELVRLIHYMLSGYDADRTRKPIGRYATSSVLYGA